MVITLNHDLCVRVFNKSTVSMRFWCSHINIHRAVDGLLWSRRADRYWDFRAEMVIKAGEQLRTQRLSCFNVQDWWWSWHWWQPYWAQTFRSGCQKRIRTIFALNVSFYDFTDARTSAHVRRVWRPIQIWRNQNCWSLGRQQIFSFKSFWTEKVKRIWIDTKTQNFFWFHLKLEHFGFVPVILTSLTTVEDFGISFLAKLAIAIGFQIYLNKKLSWFFFGCAGKSKQSLKSCWNRRR